MTTEADDDILAGTVIATARDLVERNGCLYPFGAFAPAEGGDVVLVAPRGEGPLPGVGGLLEEVVIELRSAVETGRASAVAVCADVLVRLPGADSEVDAIRVSVERPEAPVRAYVLPYRRDGLLTTFEDLLVSPAQGLVIEA